MFILCAINTFLIRHPTSHSVSFFPLLVTSLLLSSSQQWASSPCVYSPLSPESQRLPFSLIPFNISPSSSSSFSRAPQGHPPSSLHFDQSSYFAVFHLRHRRKHKSLTRIIFQDWTGKSSTKPYSLHISASVRVRKKNKPHSWSDSDPQRVHRVQVPEEEQTDDPHKRCFYFTLCCCYFSPPQGGSAAQQPTSLNNKLVVLHVDVTGADLKMKLWSLLLPVGAAGI